MYTTGENLFLSLLITLATMIPVVLALIAYRYRVQIKQKLSGIEAVLAKPGGVIVFRIAQYLLAFAGILVLLATLLPGLFPFLDPYLNKNIGLGGIVYVFIWPILCIQIILALIPYPRSWIVQQPVAAWVVLLVIGHMAINFDIMALNGMYDFSLNHKLIDY